jgi:beta-glucosidase
MITMLEGILGAVSIATKVTPVPNLGESPVDKWWLDYALTTSEVIIAALGTMPADEGEEGAASESECGGDRLNIEMPKKQEEFLKKLVDTGKPVVLILTGGSPIACKWATENIPAILMVWYPGEQGGSAVADVLFGDYNPAGRLPVTFVKNLEQVPPFEDYNMAGRTYRFMTEEPLYRFGYGLSYTDFKYSNLRLNKNQIGANETIAVSVEVANTGEYDGDEVVQMYISDKESSVPVPLLHLEGFQRIHLKKGEKKQIAFQLKPEQLMVYDDNGEPFIEPGEFLISVGGGQPFDKTSGAISTILKVV